MPMASFQYHHRPMVPVEVRDANGGWQTVMMLADSGNDITILTLDTASRLGFDQIAGTVTPVKGLGHSVTPYKRLENVIIQIGNTQPIPITVLIGDTDINLLGREDVFSNFSVTYTGNEVHYHQTCNFCGGV